MTVDNLYLIVYNFLYSHQIFALCIGVGLIIFFWKKPWEFMKLACIAVALLALFYVFSIMTESVDTDTKYEMSEKEKKLLEE